MEPGLLSLVNVSTPVARNRKKEILKISAFIWNYFALKPNHSKSLLLFKIHTLI